MHVVGVLQESVQFRWTINRSRENITIDSVKVYKGTGRTGFPQVFALSDRKPVKSSSASNRLSANIEGNVDNDILVTYNVVLKNIDFNDSSTSFYLNAIFQPLKQSGATVTLVQVKGTHFCCFFVLFFFCKFLCVKFFQYAFLKTTLVFFISFGW